MTVTIPVLDYMLSLFRAPDFARSKPLKHETLDIQSMPLHMRRDLGLEGHKDNAEDRLATIERMLFR